MSKPVQFFLRCDPDARFFYVVEFHPTQASLEATVAELSGRSLEEVRAEELEAVCLRYVVKSDPNLAALQKKYVQIGTIFFVRDNAPPQVVVHELTHAAIGWARRAKVNPLKTSKNYARSPEERFARTLQYLFEQFYDKAPQALSRD